MPMKNILLGNDGYAENKRKYLVVYWGNSMVFIELIICIVV